MKKIFVIAMLVLGLCVTGTVQAAEKETVAKDAAAETIKTNPKGNNVLQFTGNYWLNSTPQNQEAYLFGLESAITVEILEHDRQATEKGSKKRKIVNSLSSFAKGWSEAFVNTSRKEIAEAVTNWYNAHPDSLEKPVLAVIWYDIIQPRLAGKTTR